MLNKNNGNIPSRKLKHRTIYFSNQELITRFETWCADRGLATGKAIQCILLVYMQDLELQKHLTEIALPFREIKFA